jgi:hypothetical protein
LITGNKPSGYIADMSNRVIGETRQCVHCQYTWVYQPGSGNRRGFCTKCNGLLCGSKKCFDSCAPFSEVAGDKNYVFSNAGIFLRK